MFNTETYKARREHLRNTLKKGIILFVGNDETGANYEDNTYNFRQDSCFLYYFGVNRPGLFALMDIDGGKDYIFGDNATIDLIVWTGSQPSISDLATQYGVENTGSLSDLRNKLNGIDKNEVMYLPPYRPEHLLKIHEYLGISFDKIKQHKFVDLIMAIGNQRNIKSEEEIEEIEHAVNATVKMHQAAMRYALPGMKEYEVAAKVHEAALAAGGGLSFPIIATINGQFLHNHYHGNTIRSGQLFLLDAGYESPLGYAGDMSSTFPVDRIFTDRQKKIYEIALKAHNTAIDMLRPGLNYKEVHLAVGRIIFDQLKELGLTRGNTEDAVTCGAYALFFPCGTGHLMGLDVHDMENLGEQYIGYGNTPKSTQFGIKSLRLGRELQPGYVLTVEPGIYFIPELIDYWQKKGINKEFINFEAVNKYRDFGGIRNEEDILITENGHRILGDPLAKSVEDVENERAKAFS
ncbi:aminopeptidase P family protein [Porphyromonas pogonae]|uniref:aminopeptidase P family protein n=1 Tax=Porphyromonas pogonae TaxID=867595 RepID=UPI002E776E03|nr:aminopeptidase P family protein [Porphyromonas pogonae]